MRKERTIFAMLGAAVLLAGCQKHHEQPVETETNEAPKPVAPVPPPVAPAPKPKPAAAPKPKPAAAASADQQVLDDADATGMTARVDRAGNDSSTQAGTTNEQQ